MVKPRTVDGSTQEAVLTPIKLRGFHPSLQAACSTCTLAQLCLPRGLNQAELKRMDRLVTRSPLLHAGEHLFRTGDAFKAIYAVRAGSLKSYAVDSEGDERVLGFHLAGELLGLDAIYPTRHLCGAVALETASVCIMPFGELRELAGEIGGLRAQLLRLMSKDISDAAALAGDFSAEERVAAFMLGISRRYERCGRSPKELHLTMSRRDIANYLRLAPETVSRVFARFEKEQLIAVERRSIRLLDTEKLHTLSRCMGELHA